MDDLSKVKEAAKWEGSSQIDVLMNNVEIMVVPTQQLTALMALSDRFSPTIWGISF
jgi:hypothetical protein